MTLTRQGRQAGELIAAVDVGTSKICALVAELRGPNDLRIIASGQVPSRGFSKGLVDNMQQATAAIGEAISEVERRAAVQIDRAYVGIAGSHIETLTAHAPITVARPHRGVTQEDIDRALESARANAAVASNRVVIHVLPRSYTLDGQKNIHDPLGMRGYRLEVDAIVITGAEAAVGNLVECVQAHGVQIEDLVLEPLASGEAVLTQAERQLGVAIADIGAGTTDLAIFLDGTLWHTRILDVGGDHLTRDLAVALHAPIPTAEAVKIRYGHVLPTQVSPDDRIPVSVFGENGVQPVSRVYVADVLRARAEEMLELVLKEVKRSGYDGLLPAGVVLTGGVAQTPGLRQLGREMLQLPVRVGAPNGLAGLSEEMRQPAYATTVGLLLWALRSGRSLGSEGPHASKPPLLDRIVQWLRNLLPE